MISLAKRLGCTEGQAYSVAITLGLALLLVVGGLGPVLRFHPVAASGPSTGLVPVQATPSAAPVVAPVVVASPTPEPVVPLLLPPPATLPVAPPAAPSPTPQPFPTTAFPPVVVSDVPVLVKAGWSGPLGDGTTTPAGDLGLGNELVGQTVSYFEVAWTGSSLSVSFDPGANVNQDSALATAQVCAITATTWSANQGGSSGPAYDCSHPGTATPTATGFALDLSHVPADGAYRSFALVPTATAPFHVALRDRVFP